MQQTLRSFWTRVSGLRMHALAGGDTHRVRADPPLVLLHGLGVSSTYWRPLARLLARDRLVLVPELPGTGRSQRPVHALDIPELGLWLEAWLTKLGYPRATFVANSCGCQVMVDLAARAPERVERLVLIGPTVDPRWRSLKRQIPRWLIETTREPLRLLPTLAFDYLRYGPLRFLRTGRYALDHPTATLLPQVSAKTLVLRGERDGFASREWLEVMATLLPDGDFAEIPDAAHAAHYAQPAAVARIVRSFLDEPDRLSEAARRRTATAPAR